MHNVFAIVLIVVAAILFYFGLEASDSIASTVERAVQGTPSDRSIWLLLAAAVCGVVGVVGLVRNPRPAR